MNLRFLETFVWVARLKSFSLTAEKLHTTQAAISHRIATLERELGVRLFERDARDVRLTAEGADALDHAERIVRAAAEFRRRMSDPKALRGTVRIGVIDTIAHSWLPQLIDRLRHTYPDVALELNADTSVDIAKDILANEVDLGLMMGPVEGHGIVNIELCTFACVWVASPRLGVPDGPLELTDLARFPILSFPRSSKPHKAMVGYFQRLGEEEVRLHTAGLSTLIRLASDGLGVAAIPAATIQREIAEGTLLALNVRQPFPPLSLHAVYQEAGDRPLPGLIAEIAREVADAFCRSVDPLIAW
ncbi:LysR family transcriptional regulator [Chelatococcus sp. SYSU_G07232]|uniref:LysR family transcriptional regulator n=1 Tax=Chelatococcus albus TaxID=3047466 RepID=A0ABT7AE23_9HYPH|nr:LysR family transcriptional regulator [Chelatococcus sp. SYSU_G07232]MDJ1157636.1 LysR family transcriptional regulator [Chelatococcus sp. SYSU_G07232]